MWVGRWYWRHRDGTHPLQSMGTSTDTSQAPAPRAGQLVTNELGVMQIVR